MTSITSTFEASTCAAVLDSTRVLRSWQASLALTFAYRGSKTAVTRASHYGPLRIQRPFYPEGECAHVYLLHPPGGLVVGDSLGISLTAESGSAALITTPSAGKVYSLDGLQHSDVATTQSQRIDVKVAENAHLEWLPQETIIFNGANARLHTKLVAATDSTFTAWDIVCLGRPACNETFTTGSVHQDLEVWVDGVPKLIERNRIEGSDALMQRPWGLNGAGSLGTFVASANPSRDCVDALVASLDEPSSGAASHWGLTQKEDLFVARYVGPSAYECRKGFIRIWQAIRQDMCGRAAVEPRIWNT
ncbi:urease accessory protein UreD [Gilvimarinus sp. SDUM040013]|uniref:Urease accessory protein UreD n=1 Tax=Gilvimarinus gilvus TaxID=3058038 RepID=A0ABU4S091_9GAMM|nr:urease accessory protein UreD [Gilvimarinus sp. SDUM040013]MDO3388819.1 urease accessory protein UreD [Gilvimarinus sp. SDUM040013]MDX6850572.1 urease accessory protein UreD [Gilvimarinus sp. SDUM040013]